MSYATLGDFRDEMDQIPAGAGEDARIQKVLDRATAIIDNYLGWAWGTAAAADRVIIGDGSSVLWLPPYVAGSITVITAGSGFTTPTYIEQPDGSLLAIDAYTSGGWLRGLPYTVSADFGFGSPPADIVQACLEIAARIWKAPDAAYSDVVGVEGSGGELKYNRALTSLTKLTLDGYKARYAARLEHSGTLRLGRSCYPRVPSNAL